MKVGISNMNKKIMIIGAGEMQIPIIQKVRELGFFAIAIDRNNNASFIAEFAIGTNPTAKVTGVILEDEKALGTSHIAFGDNTSFKGGKNNSILHLDIIIQKPTIRLDNKIIMEKGELLI